MPHRYAVLIDLKQNAYELWEPWICDFVKGARKQWERMETDRKYQTEIIRKTKKHRKNDSSVQSLRGRAFRVLL